MSKNLQPLNYYGKHICVSLQWTSLLHIYNIYMRVQGICKRKHNHESGIIMSEKYWININDFLLTDVNINKKIKCKHLIRSKLLFQQWCVNFKELLKLKCWLVFIYTHRLYWVGVSNKLAIQANFVSPWSDFQGHHNVNVNYRTVPIEQIQTHLQARNKKKKHANTSQMCMRGKLHLHL